MNQYVITTDINSDLPREILDRFGIKTMALHYTIDDKQYRGDTDEITPEQFYDEMRAGKSPQTMQVNPAQAMEVFEACFREGFDVLHIGFSSALSGSVGSAAFAAKEAMEKYPGRKAVVIDSLCASLGQGLLIYKAALLREEGKSLEESAAWAEANKLKVCHYFTVDDLVYLQRGGRVSKTAAFFGTMLNIKPVLHVNDEGKLIPLYKTRGRKQSLNALVENMKSHMGSEPNDIFFISHGDCIEDANYVADLVKNECGIQECLINFVGPTIGAHSGPGTVALFFFGEKR